MTARRRRGRRPAPARLAVAHVRANRAIWALWAAASVWLTWFAIHVNAYFVMPDELRYIRQAVAWGEVKPVVPGSEAWVTWSQLQPLLMAPIWTVFHTLTAYRLTHVLDALLYASAVFPAYLLGRRVLRSHRWALVAAVLALVLPWSVLAGVVMLEDTAYPVTLWALLAVLEAAVRPSLRANLIALAALALAYFARTQLVVLWATLPVALVAQELRFPARPGTEARERARAFAARTWPIAVLGGLAAIAVLVDIKLLLGDAPRGRLIAASHFSYGRENLAYIAVGIGMLPLALSFAWVAATLGRPLSREGHAYAVIVLTTGVLLTILVAGGSGEFLPGVNDRYLFYLAPLLMIGMLAFCLERRPLTAVTLVAGVAAGAVAWASDLDLAGATFVTPTATFHPALFAFAQHFGTTIGPFFGVVCAVLTAAVALARRLLRPELVAVAVVVVVGAYCFGETTYTRNKLLALQLPADYGKGRDWVDRALPGGGRAAVLLSSLGAGQDTDSVQATWWDLSFWNRRVVADRYAPGETGFFADQAVIHPLTFDRDTGTTDALGDLRYLVRGVADRRFGFPGEAMLVAPHNNLRLTRLPRNDRLAFWFRSADETGALRPGRRGVLRVFGDGTAGPRRVTLLLGTPLSVTRPASFSVRLDGRTVTTGRVRPKAVASRTVDVTLPAAGHVDLAVQAGPDGGGVQFYDSRLAPA